MSLLKEKTTGIFNEASFINHSYRNLFCFQLLLVKANFLFNFHYDTFVSYFFLNMIALMPTC